MNAANGGTETLAENNQLTHSWLGALMTSGKCEKSADLGLLYLIWQGSLILYEIRWYEGNILLVTLLQLMDKGTFRRSNDVKTAQYANLTYGYFI